MTVLTSHRPNRPLIWPDSVLAIQDWLLETDQPVYIVGGAVRDAYLHRPIHDLDLVTPTDAIGLGRRMADHFDGDVYIMDRERDVVRVLTESQMQGKLVIDIARFRGDNLFADLVDRDFTFNAMAVDMRGDLNMLIDPLEGEKDLIEKVIRTCAKTALDDDPARALRAIRQSVQFTARIEPKTRQAIRDVTSRLNEVSSERIRDEFFKLLGVDKPTAALRAAETLGLLRYVIPETDWFRDDQDGWQYTLQTVEKLSNIVRTISPKRTDLTAAVFDLGMVVMSLDMFRGELQDHLAAEWPNERQHKDLLLFGALLHHLDRADESVSGEMAERLAVDLRLSNPEKQRLVTMIRYRQWPGAFIGEPSDLDMHRFWQQLDVAGIDVCLLYLASYLASAGTNLKQDDWLIQLACVQTLFHAYFKRHDDVVAPPSVIDGTQLMEVLNLEPGPQIGQLLNSIREAQVTGAVKSMEDALNLARQQL